ncbi:DUF748 domain-containing protein [Stenotrophobium rhamnosiphilum]|uniref:DUF748 domain-containing protein n=1 Tax=Stenotrophobium rhamnosiphilum TaxID=2029166 RepID=UPI0013753309|nr:DUF748 domain-containing protein [Stenotrophobium rhamnosiphilum]
MTKKQKWLVILTVTLVVIVGGYVVLPLAMKTYINHRLENLPNYRGHVDGLSVSLLAGSYQLQNITLEQLNSATNEPLFTATTVDVAILWGSLFKGLIVAEIAAHNPKINFAAAHAGKEAQSGFGVNWVNVVGEITPFRIDRLEIINGEIHYYDHFSNPPVNIYLSKTQATLTNLANSDKLASNRPSHLVLSAQAMDRSNLFTDVFFNPFKKEADFKLKLKLIAFPVKALRNFMHAYTPVDPSGGTLDLVIEANAEKGNIEGYVKPLFHELKLEHWETASDHKLQPLRFFSNTMGDVVNFLFRNQAENQLASKVPFSGKIDDPSVDVLSAVLNVLRNAFVGAFKPQFDSAKD